VTDLRPKRPGAAGDDRKVVPELAAGVLKGREFRPVTVPRTEVKGDMRLVTAAEVKDIRYACRAMMAEMGIQGHGLTAYPEYLEEFNLRLVAASIRLPAARDQPLADIDAWRQCDPDQIATLFALYQAMEAELDPLGAGAAGELGITEQELAEIEALAKRKDVGQLTSFGSPKLARALTSLVDPPPS
jgi:hypothetical protein